MPVYALIYGEQSSFGDKTGLITVLFDCFMVLAGWQVSSVEILEPLLIPVGIKTPIEFQGKNLEKYSVKYIHYLLLYIVWLCSVYMFTLI